MFLKGILIKLDFLPLIIKLKFRDIYYQKIVTEECKTG